MVAHIRIGDMLVAAGFVTDAQVEEALSRQRDTGRRLGAELLEMGFVTEVQFTQVLSNQLSVPWVSLAHVQFTRDLLNLVPATLAQQFGVVPIYIRHVRKAGDTLFVAMRDPTDEDALGAIVSTTSMPVKPMIAPPSEIDNAIRVYYLGAHARRTSQLAPPAANASAPPPPPTLEVAAAPADTDEPEATQPADATEIASPPAADAPAADAPTADAPETENPHDVGADESAAGDAEEASGDKPESWAPQAREPAISKAAAPRMITLTLLDGTTVRLPAPGGGGAAAEAADEDANHGLTAHDLVAALQARAQGKEVGDVLPDDRWELLFSTLLTLLIKKGLVADWEFVEEWERQRGK